MSPKLNKGFLLMRAQALPEDKAKMLLNFLLSCCFMNDDVYKAVNSGLKGLENKTATVVKNATVQTEEGK